MNNWHDNLKPKSDNAPKRIRVSKGTLVKAIKENCYQCSGESRPELHSCTVEHCPLWPYRLGITPANLQKASIPTREKASPTNSRGV